MADSSEGTVLDRFAIERDDADKRFGTRLMGPLAIFGLLWLAGAAVYLFFTLIRRPPRWSALWHSKYGESWPMSRRGQWACVAALTSAGGLCILHDLAPTWDAFTVPVFFAVSGYLLVVRWLDRLASEQNTQARHPRS